MTHLLEVSDLSVRYGSARAVSNASLTALGGRVTALVGPNGAGKSSLLLATYGSVAGTGNVSLNGASLSALTALDRARRGVALVPQGRQLFPRMTVRENIEVMASLLKLPRGASEAALRRFPILTERANALAGILSGGEQQMLVVTRALMAEPQVLLLDEMVTGLAPLIVDQLIETLQALAASGMAILLAEPDISHLGRVIDRGYVIIRGRIVHASESAEDLKAAYLEAMSVVLKPVAAGHPAP